MPLRLPAYQPIPAPDQGTDLIEVSAAQLQPTQWCVGLAEIWSREKDFARTPVSSVLTTCAANRSL